MNTEPSTEQRVALSKAMQILNVFCAVGDGKMTIGEAFSLLVIASGESKDGAGITVTELGVRGKFALSSASRYVGSLGKEDRHGKPGAELITAPRDPNDDRRKILRLTPKGHRMVDEITNIVRA
jgi:DNA-binding MarR family transcriptional regulator